MLKIKKLALLPLAAALIFSGSIHTASASPSDESAAPIRVGYIESESYSSFTYGLAGIAQGLEERGVISDFAHDPLEDDARSVWKAMAAAESEHILFAEDMFFTLKSMGGQEAARAVNSDEIDLLIVMGTVAGVFVSEREEKNDYMVFAAADPILSGIVKSETERFTPNSYAYIDPSRYRRQVDIAYHIFGFTKLGVVYENTPAAYAYSGIGQAELSAVTNGFSVERRYVDEARDDADMDRYYRELKAAYKQLIDEGIDALYITTATTEDHMLPWLLEDIAAAGIPTISQAGESQVRNGAVFGVTLDDPADQGRFIAHVIEQYLEGTPIDTLPQVYEIVPKIFVNYDAATRSGILFPFKTLISMDEIFRDEW
ncbi:MAG: hypothetical protein FWH02_00930 [Oscillospiraceae bacterium]|nr:hypothetical protein [Oscillospiraceae bacterium]